MYALRSKTNGSPKTFDDQQSELLLPLAAAGITAYVPFFANTFPFGYHYARTLEMLPDTISKVDAPQIINHEWVTEIPFDFADAGSKLQMFYGTEETLKGMLDKVALHNATTSSDLELGVLRAFVTDYQPKKFFAPYGGGIKSLFNLSDWKSAQENFSLAEIYTDVPEQAAIVRKYLEVQLRFRKKRIRVIETYAEARSFDAGSFRVLRLHFYGAPLTAALSENRREFHAIDLPTSLWDEDKFRTFALVLGPKRRLDGNLVSVLETYHAELFRCAEYSQASLRNVWWAYNRAADIRFYPPKFRNVESFAYCLWSHHSNSQVAKREADSAGSELAGGRPKITKPAAIDTTPTVHVHFGAGQLGIGFVLPLLKCDKLIVIQKSGSAKPERCLQGKEVSFENNRGYKELFRVYETPPPFEQLADRAVILLDYGDDVATQRCGQYINMASSISTSCNQGQIAVAGFLKAVKTKTKLPLFAFENKIAKELSALAQFNVHKCVPDRICVLEPCGRTRKKKVSSESFIGEAFVTASILECERVFRVGSSNVICPIADELYIFYYSRKRYLVNGLHFILALLALKILQKLTVPKKAWRSQLLALCQSTLESRPEEAHLVRIYIDTQIVRLIADTDPRIRLQIFGSADSEKAFYDLRHYAESALRRMREAPDFVGRILDISDDHDNHAVNLKCSEHIVKPYAAIADRKGEILELRIREAPPYIEMTTALSSLQEDFSALALSRDAGPRGR